MNQGAEVDVIVLGVGTCGLLGLAVHARVPISELQSMIYVFPTFFGTIGEAIGAWGRGLETVIDPRYEGFDLLDEVGI